MVLRLYGYSAWIESEGVPLEEYAIEVEDNVISCYVCSEEGKQFTLQFDDDGSHYSGPAAPFDLYGRVVDIKMDGSRMDNLWGDFRKKITSQGMYAGDLIGPYIFAPIDTTDDDDVAAKDDPKHEHIGTIQVDLRRGVRIGPGTGNFQRTAPSTSPIHERSKKAGSHRVVLGDWLYKPSNPVKIHYMDQVPWVTFRFLYRKRDMLKAQGILPKSPSPSPPPSNSPGPSVKAEDRKGKGKGKGVKREREEKEDGAVIEINSDDDDIESLQEELKLIQGRIARKKAKKSVKREDALYTSGDIIDLT